MKREDFVNITEEHRKICEEVLEEDGYSLKEINEILKLTEEK